jgi:hypothetical protein
VNRLLGCRTGETEKKWNKKEVCSHTKSHIDKCWPFILCCSKKMCRICDLESLSKGVIYSCYLLLQLRKLCLSPGIRQTNSVAFSPQANCTYRATAAAGEFSSNLGG